MGGDVARLFAGVEDPGLVDTFCPGAFGVEWGVVDVSAEDHGGLELADEFEEVRVAGFAFASPGDSRAARWGVVYPDPASRIRRLGGFDLGEHFVADFGSIPPGAACEVVAF